MGTTGRCPMNPLLEAADRRDEPDGHDPDDADATGDADLIAEAAGDG